MSNNIIMQVKVGEEYIALHPETTASLIKLPSGITLQQYIDEANVIKVEDGKLYYKDDDGSYKILPTVSTEFKLEPATGVSFESLENLIAVKWTDPVDVFIESSSGNIPLATWAGTKLVAKVGSPPSNMNDGTILVDSKVRDQFKTDTFVGTLEMNRTYYLKLFPYTTDGLETELGDSMVVTTTNIILDEPVATAVAVDDKAYLMWTDPVDKTGVFNGATKDTAKWSKTVVVTKKGSSPANITDGTIVGEFTVRDAHKTTPLVVTKLTEGLNYFKFFPVTVDGDVTNVTNTQYPVTVSYGILPDINDLQVTVVGNGVNVLWSDPMESIVDVSGTPAKTALWAKSALVMKQGSAPTSISDGTMMVESTTYNQYKSTSFNIPTLTKDVDVFFKVFVTTTNGKISASNTKNVKIISSNLPSELGPGPTSLMAGNEFAGYFGEVAPTDIISGTTLAEKIGLQYGTDQSNGMGWLKFILDGKILFVAKKPFRHSVLWADMDAYGAADGTNTIKIGNLTYKVRLLKGWNSNIGNTGDIRCHGSEWNRLMLPIHIKAKDKSWHDPATVESNLPYWGIDFTDADLYTDSDKYPGSRSWCQDWSNIPENKIHRGGYDASSWSNGAAGVPGGGGASVYGWRPVLELIPSSQIHDITGSPGAVTLKYGDMNYGYFGTVPSSILINGSTLASRLGLTQGYPSYNNEPWLKFALDGKILFVARKPLRYNLSWLDINNVGAIDGTATTNIKSVKCSIRVLKTFKYTSPNVSDMMYGEWNRLLLPLHVMAKDKSFPSHVQNIIPPDLPYWGTDYTDADLITVNNYSGSVSWCQESAQGSGWDQTHKMARGGYDGIWNGSAIPTSGYPVPEGLKFTDFGWRPVLEVTDWEGKK